MAGWHRAPMLHFAVLGGLLFAIESAWPAPVGSEPLVIPAARVERLRESWRAQTGRPPDAAELAALVEAEIDDEVLLRAARELDLHRLDPLVRRRLVRNLRFVGEAEADERSDDALFEQALDLGMDRTDLVVRRRLVQRMRLLARARVSEPTPAEVADFYERHRDRWVLPGRVRISQVYLSRDRRGEAAEADARRLLAALRRNAVAPERTQEYGDPLLLRPHLPLESRRELAASFGPDFAGRVQALEPGAWHGPVPSSYGQHLVWVHERLEPRAEPLASVEDEVRGALLEERARAALDRELGALRARYRVGVEGAGS